MKGLLHFFAGRSRSRAAKTAGNRPHQRRLRVEGLESRELLSGDSVFAVIGDYGANTAGEAAVAQMVKNWTPDLILTTGDNNYQEGSAATIDANVGQYYHDYIGNYLGSYGAGSATNRFFPTLGHHDWLTAGAQPYLNYFTLPGNERYYDFVSGPVHFFAIDSVPDEPDGRSSSSTQAQWLQARLAAATEPYKVVYFAYPPYSSGADIGSDATMQWPFKAWGATVVLSGHAHDYERLNVGGFPLIVNGLGGEELAGFSTPVAGSLVRFNGDFGAMKIVANTTNLTLTFYSVAQGQTKIDSLTISNQAPSDALGSAAMLLDPNVVATGSNATATKEVGEPSNAGVAGGHSVWWNWTAPGSGRVTISTAGSSFDTTLGVYTGATVNALTAVASNDNESTSVTSSAVAFNAVAGQVYHLSIDGKGAAAGNVRLNIGQLLSGPANDNFAGATVLTGSAPTATGANATATLESGEPSNAGVKGGHSLWWNWTAPASGSATITTAGSSFDTTLGVYTGSQVNSLAVVAGNDDENAAQHIYTSKVVFSAVAGQTYRISVDGYNGLTGTISFALTLASSAPANDKFSTAAPLTGTSATATGNNQNATLETGEPANAGVVGGHSLWWTWVAPSAGQVTISTAGSSFDTTLGVYTGSAVNALTGVASNDDASSGVLTSRVSFNAIANTTYRISVDGYKGATGAVSLSLSLTSGAPPNDSFSQATVLQGTSLTTTGSNVNATAETGEPSNAGISGGRSVWWIWTAPSSGTVTLTTAGSSFDTTLGVYTGSAVNSLTAVAANDDENTQTGLFTSRLTFSAILGRTYYICVDGYHGASGSIALALQMA